MVGSVRSEAIGGVRAETESIHLLEKAKNVVWEWCCQSSLKRLHLLSQIPVPFCRVVSCRILDGVELSENTRVDHRALAVSFHSSIFSCKPVRRREFARVLLPRPVEFYVVMSGGKKPSSSACHVLF